MQFIKGLPLLPTTSTFTEQIDDFGTISTGYTQTYVLSGNSTTPWWRQSQQGIAFMKVGFHCDFRHAELVEPIGDFTKITLRLVALLP